MGILLSRFVSFEIRELLAAGVAFVLLAIVAHRRALRGLALVCVLLGVACLGALLQTIHTPGPPPTIDANFDETVSLAGCVVSPPGLYEGRDQFLLELAPGAFDYVGYLARQDIYWSVSARGSESVHLLDGSCGSPKTVFYNPELGVSYVMPSTG